MDIAHPSNWNENICEQYTFSTNILGHVRKEEDFSADKILMEIQVLDKLACPDGSSHDMVRDICIDDGLHSLEKVFIENEVGEKILSVGHSVVNRNGDPSKELTDGDAIIAHDSLSRSICEPLVGVDKDTEEEHSFDNLFSGGSKTNSTEQNVVDYSDEKISSKKLFPPEYYHADPQKGCSIGSSCRNDCRQATSQATVKEVSVCTVMPTDSNNLIEESPENGFLKSMHEECSGAVGAPSRATESNQYCRIEPDTVDGLSGGKQEEGHSVVASMISDIKEYSHENVNFSCLNTLTNSTLQDGSSAVPAVYSDAQVSNQNNGPKEKFSEGISGGMLEGQHTAAKSVQCDATRSNYDSLENLANCESDTGVNTCDSNPRETETVGTDGRKETPHCQQPVHAQSNPLVEEFIVDGGRNLVVTSVSHNHGDFNLSGSDLLSGQTASLGYIPYSGSISFRSESSATSTRSFAFPILQNEWNSSPVKMAKAKRRRFKNYQNWKSGLLCCKF